MLPGNANDLATRANLCYYREIQLLGGRFPSERDLRPLRQRLLMGGGVGRRGVVHLEGGPMN
eukprot:376498-Prorocentrum_minimum.AAC.10